MNQNNSPTLPPHQPYEKVKLDECHICLEYLVGEIAEVSCGHIYHLDCIQAWVAKKGNHRCCCICQSNTEIVNIINLPNTKIKNIIPAENCHLINNQTDINYNQANIPNNQNGNQNHNRNIKNNRCCQIL